MTQQLPTPEQIHLKLTQELNISHLTEEEQSTIITQMSTILLDRITMAIVSLLPQDIMTQVDKLLEADQTEAVQALLLKHVPQAPSIASAVIAETMGEYDAIIANKAQDEAGGETI